MRLRSGRTLGHGDFAAPRREPLDLLQLHPVPGRIADHSVETAGQPGAFPLRPHTGKSHLPIEEAFVVEELLCFGCLRCLLLMMVYASLCKKGAYALF